MSKWIYMIIKGQGHSLILVQGHSDSTFSNLFSLESLCRLKPNFMWLLRGMEIVFNYLGHMTKMAAMPIYGKNIKKSSSPEPKGRWPWNLICSIGYSSTNKFIQVMTLGWPWLILLQGQIWSLCFCMWKKVKTMTFFRHYYSLWYKSC